MTKRNLSDWLEYYLKYTQNSEPPTQYHLWSGIAAISSCLQRKCWSSWAMSGGDIYPNFYIALVGPPGGRKGTAMKFAKEFILDLGVPVASDSLGSIQALYKEIGKAKLSYKDDLGNIVEYLSLSVWAEELTVFLTHQDSIFVKSITDLFDTPSKWKYASLKQGVMPLSNCYLTIIGAITPSLLQESLTSVSMGGGLFSRIIFVVGYGKIKKIPLGFLSREEQILKRQLYEDLEVISQISGQFKLSNDFMDVYVPWYMGPEATNGVDSDKFVGYNDRRALHLKKLCMIFSASESNEMIINKHHFKKALKTLQYTEHEMASAFYGLGRGAHAGVMTDLMRFFEEREILTFSDIVARFQLDASLQDLTNYIASLESSRKIKVEISTTGKSRYVWLGTKKKDAGLNYLNSSLFNQMDSKIGG